MKNLQVSKDVINCMNYRGLQSLAKDLGVKANGKTEDLRSRIIDAVFAEAPVADQIDEEADFMGIDEVSGVAKVEVGTVNAATDGLRTDKMYRGVRSVVCQLDCDGVITFNFGRNNYVCNECGVVYEEADFKAIVDSFVDGQGTVDPSTVDKVAARLGLTQSSTLDSASEASASTEDSEPVVSVSDDIVEVLSYSKVFEFVRADNCIVHFKQKGVDVKIGWSKKDFKFYILKDKKAKLYSPQSAINAFKPFVDGKHGDIKRIVHALVRIKTKPSVIKAMEQQARAGQQGNVSPVSQKENQTTTNRRSKYQPIDPTWLANYRKEQGENFDGRKVREAYCQAIADGLVNGLA